jgi:hypothetical protein
MTLRERAEANRLALRRLEKEARRYAEAKCNGAWHFAPYHKGGTTLRLWTGSEAEEEAYEQHLLARLTKLMDNAEGLFINLDPRGYALKVTPDAAGDLPTDWGGYGLLAPDRER